MQPARLKRLTSEELDQLVINTIRTLSIDAVQQAKSGHLDTPMALAHGLYHLESRAALRPTRPDLAQSSPLRVKHVNQSMTHIGDHNGRDFGRAGAPA